MSQTYDIETASGQADALEAERDRLQLDVAKLAADNAALLAALEGAISHDNALKAEYKMSPSLRRQMEAAIAQAKAGA